MRDSLKAALIALYLLASPGFAPAVHAGQVLTETIYFTEGFKPDMKVPVPDNSWKVYAKRKILLGDKVEGIEELDGADRGRISWLVGKIVASIEKNGVVAVHPKDLGEASLWDSPLTDTTWIKTLKPIHKLRYQGQEVLVYETGGGFKRIWMQADPVVPIAQVEGRFVTFFQKESGNPDVRPPQEILKAIEKEHEAERKLSKFGAMPQ